MQTFASPTRHRSPAGRALGVAAVAVCLLALGCSGQPMPGTAPVAPASTAAQPGIGQVKGRVTLPEDLVGAHQVIPTGIGRVIPTGMGRVVPTGVGRYRVAAVAAELPVTGATVTALDPATRQPISGVPATATDETGAFALTGLAPDAEVLIAVTFRPRGGDQDFRLLAIARSAVPAEAPRPVPPTEVTWRSTAAVSEHLAAHAGAYVSPAPDALAAREAALAEQAATLGTTERLAVITQAILAPLLPASPSPAPGTGGSTPALPLPSPLASTLTGVTETVTDTTKTVVGATKPLTNVTQSVVSGATQTVTGTTQTVTAPLASAVPVVGAVTGVVTGTLGLLPTPAPTATPTPKPTATPLLNLPLF